MTKLKRVCFFTRFFFAQLLLACSPQMTRVSLVSGHGAVHRGGSVLWRVTYQVLNLCSFSCSGKTQGLSCYLQCSHGWCSHIDSASHTDPGVQASENKTSCFISIFNFSFFLCFSSYFTPCQTRTYHFLAVFMQFSCHLILQWT